MLLAMLRCVALLFKGGLLVMRESIDLEKESFLIGFLKNINLDI